MGDKRTDPGHYYPGGRVRAKSGTAPQELIVQWSDVQGKPQIAPLPDRYREDDMKGKINEIASKFATVVVAALIGWTACADITVQKKRKDQIYNDEQIVVDVSGEGVGMNTNTIIDIANATIATNHIVAAKLDGPAVAPTNTAEAAGKAADAQLTGIALTNRYTKAETDAKLAGKLSLISEIQTITARNSEGREAYLRFASDGVLEVPEDILFGDLTSLRGTISFKANRPSSYTAGDLAALDENGDLVDSGIAEEELAKVDDLDSKADLNGDFSETFEASSFITDYGVVVGDDVTIPDAYGDPIHRLSAKADRSMISATDPTFSNAVLQTVIPNLPTNITAEVYIAATNACANLGIDPALIPQGGTLGTVGGILVALAAAVALLRKKTKLLKSDGTAEDDFATDLIGKQVAKEAIVYKANTTSTLKDRAFNALSLDGTEYNLSTALAAVTPTVANQPRDLLLVATATAATTISFTSGTIKGDKPTIDGAGTWLITLTEYASGVWYCRQIKMEDAA